MNHPFIITRKGKLIEQSLSDKEKLNMLIDSVSKMLNKLFDSLKEKAE